MVSKQNRVSLSEATIKALLPTAAEGTKLVETSGGSREAEQPEEVNSGEPKAKSENTPPKSGAPSPRKTGEESTLRPLVSNKEPKAEHLMSQSPHAKVKVLLILILLLSHLLCTDS